MFDRSAVSRLATPHRLLVALVAALVELAAFNVYQLVSFLQHRHLPDFLLIYAAAAAGAEHGWRHLYDNALQQQLISRTWGSPAPWPFLNTPLSAWLALPFTLLPFWVAYALWMALMVASVVAAGAIASAGLPRAIRAAYVLSGLAFLPVAIAVGSGQVTPLVLLAVVAAGELLRRGRDREAGAVLAVVLLKPQLGLLLPLALLAARRLRAFAACAAVSAAAGLACVVAIGGAGIAQYLALVRSFYDNPYFLRWSLVPYLPGGSWYAGAAAVALLALAGAGHFGRRDPRLALGLAAAASLLVNHYATPSDLVVLLAPLWALAANAGRLWPLVVAGWLVAWFGVAVPWALVGAETLLVAVSGGLALEHALVRRPA